MLITINAHWRHILLAIRSHVTLGWPCAQRQNARSHTFLQKQFSPFAGKAKWWSGLSSDTKHLLTQLLVCKHGLIPVWGNRAQILSSLIMQWKTKNAFPFSSPRWFRKILTIPHGDAGSVCLPGGEGQHKSLECTLLCTHHSKPLEYWIHCCATTDIELGRQKSGFRPLLHTANL